VKAGSEQSELIEHFGRYLKREREQRGILLEDVSMKTKIQEHSLKLIEEARLDALPAEVFVRGFVRAYAKAVGADPDEAIRRLETHLERKLAKQSRLRDLLDGAATQQQERGEGGVQGRRRVGVALVVLLFVIVATLAVSLLLRRPSPASGGLSDAATTLQA
jgi:cytoskeleton protein RodZ